MSLAIALLLAAQETPAERDASRGRLRDLSIADLMDVEVYTPGRKLQPLSATPAAVSVLRGEDLRRMGVVSLPDALRYVPGVQVAQFDGSSTGVSVRGFNNRFVNKLQVMMDGRSVYTPLFSGVFWEATDTLLEDVDHIEIIRGPGAASWGPNAVNGVINIITKKTADTQGGLLSVGAGTEEQGFGAARWGGRTDGGFSWRAWAKTFQRDEQYRGHDDWMQARAGGRLEWALSDREEIVVSAEAYESEAHHDRQIAQLTGPPSATLIDREDFDGGHVAAWWERRFDRGSLRIQANLEVSQRERITTGQELWIGEAVLTHRWRPLEGHDVSWGASYRFSQDEIDNTFGLSYDPAREHRDRAGIFVHDEITLAENLLFLHAGAWLEYNDHTGVEIQPTLRLSARPADGHVLWAAASRAARTPSRSDDDLRVNAAVFPGPTVLSIFGDRDVESERLTAFEAGWRFRPLETLSLDVAAFHHRYANLIDGIDGGTFTETDPLPVHDVAVVLTTNNVEGTMRGVEVSAAWDVLPAWRLQGTYALLRAWFDEENDALISDEDKALEGDPRHTATLRSSWDLPFDLELDAGARFTDRWREPEMGSWTEMDARIGWRGWKGLDVGFAGRSLLHDRHPETPSARVAGVGVTEVERAVWIYLRWTF